MKNTFNKSGNRAVALTIALILANLGLVPSSGAEAAQTAPDYSRVMVVNALKDDYLAKACRSNNLGDLLSESYSDFVSGVDGQFSDQYWERFTQDAWSLRLHSKSWSKWLTKNRTKFPKSARQAVNSMARELTKETQLLDSLSNSPTMDDLYFHWDAYDRHLLNTSYFSGQIRKSLKLPSRVGVNACP